MNAWGSLLGIITMAFAVTTQAVTLTPIIDSFTLTDLIEDKSAKVLEIRSDENAYLEQHIPGSVYLSYQEFRGPETNPGELPELSKLAKALGSRGIQADDAVVIVHNGVTTTDFGAAARVYWTLKSVGFESLAILNGGFRAYQKDGFELVTGETTVSPVNPTLVFNPVWYADTAEVAKQVAGGGSAKLLDARLDDFYAGIAWHDAAARPGILPGADQFSFEAFFDTNTPLLKHSDEIVSIVTANGLNQTGTISYCNTGHWAATNWFVLSEVAQVDGVRLYPESMVEWSALNKPMENVPTSLQFAILKTKKWFNGLVN
ncbi:MAG: rhodanese-like domain-containing protein [Pseudomonadota bacterium]|nr:rhodanese-like domain-containing protein [Pseudomonadota bacterium]